MLIIVVCWIRCLAGVELRIGLPVGVGCLDCSGFIIERSEGVKSLLGCRIGSIGQRLGVLFGCLIG